MDTESIEIHAAEEMEEAREVSADHDPSGLQAPTSSSSLDQDEPMAIGPKDRGTLCDEPSVVQEAGTGLLKRFCSAIS